MVKCSKEKLTEGWYRQKTDRRVTNNWANAPVYNEPIRKVRLKLEVTIEIVIFATK